MQLKSAHDRLAVFLIDLPEAIGPRDVRLSATAALDRIEGLLRHEFGATLASGRTTDFIDMCGIQAQSEFGRRRLYFNWISKAQDRLDACQAPKQSNPPPFLKNPPRLGGFRR